MRRTGLKKFVILAICAIMLSVNVLFPVTKALAYEEEWNMIVTTDGGNLNCRSGPGTQYSIIGKFANGTYVSFGYMDPISSEDWTYVTGVSTTGKTISGYCNNAYLYND